MGLGERDDSVGRFVLLDLVDLVDWVGECSCLVGRSVVGLNSQ